MELYYKQINKNKMDIFQKWMCIVQYLKRSHICYDYVLSDDNDYDHRYEFYFVGDKSYCISYNGIVLDYYIRDRLSTQYDVAINDCIN